MPHATVILNPTAGSGRAGTVAEQVLVGLERRGLSAELKATTAPREAASLARRAAEAGSSTVIAAGGDGTVHEVANGLLGFGATADERPVLGVLPIGTGNDFAKLLGPLEGLERSLDVVGSGYTRSLDAARASWNDDDHWFINAAGTGIDVEVVRQLVRGRGRGGAWLGSYLQALLRALVRYRPVPLRIRLDGEPLERDVTIIAAGNGRCVGGSFWICPNAQPDDGRFDICIVGPVSYIGVVRALPMIMRGTHQKHPKVEMFQAETVEIEAMGPDPLFFQLDGELHEPPAVRKLVLRVERAALRVLSETEPG